MRSTIVGVALIVAGCTEQTAQFETTFTPPTTCVASVESIRTLVREEGRVNGARLPDSERGLALVGIDERDTSVVVEIRKWDSGDDGTSSIIERWTFEPLGEADSEWCLTRVMQTFGRAAGRWAPPGPDTHEGP